MLNFPQELVDHTLDNVVVGDHRGETLKNCALVASNWTSRSQKHLFSTVYTSNVRQTERLSSVLGGRPHLSNYIHVLEICFENDLGSSHGSAFRSHSKVLVPILVSCRHIEKLVLFCGQTAFSRPFTEFYLPAWFIAMLVGVLNRDLIRHLALVNWDFARTDIIPLVAKIAVLELRSCRFGYPTDSLSSHPGPQTVTFEGIMHIGTLIVNYCTNLRIIGLDAMATLQISPALLVTPGFVEIEFSRDEPHPQLMDPRILTQLSCKYIAICIDDLYPTEIIKTWLAALRIGTGQLLRLRIAVVFWGIVAPALGSNTAVKVIAARLNEHGIRIRGQDSLHLLIENA